VTDLLALLKANQRRGSKPRCHGLTNDAVRRAAILTALIAPWGAVSADDVCMPDGFREMDEVQLHRSSRLLLDLNITGAALTSWWPAVGGPGATTPNWDIACTSTVDGQQGVLLVEAKAHHRELGEEEAGKRLKPPFSAAALRNHVRIGACIEEASIALASETGRPWALARDHHYQMSNRFAWAWKLTELGVPVILVYLGFLGCDDMHRTARSSGIRPNGKSSSARTAPRLCRPSAGSIPGSSTGARSCRSFAASTSPYRPASRQCRTPTPASAASSG
jgi:hypothetical protein